MLAHPRGLVVPPRVVIEVELQLAVEALRDVRPDERFPRAQRARASVERDVDRVVGVARRERLRVGGSSGAACERNHDEHVSTRHCAQNHRRILPSYTAEPMIRVLALRPRSDRCHGGATARRAGWVSHRRRRRCRSRQRWGATWPRSPGLPRPLRVKVDPDARHALKKSKPDIVVLCTSSSLRGVMPQIEGILKAKVPIVTTTEELSYPGEAQRAARDGRSMRMARRAKVAVLSTGRQSGIRDGRAAHHADRGVRARRVDRGQPRSGREAQAAAVSAENRRGPFAASSSSERSSVDRFGTSASRSRSR